MSRFGGPAVISAALAALLMTAPAAAEDRPMPSVDTLVRQFERIAFSNEYGGAYRVDRIVRWQGPIRVRLEGADASRYRDEVAPLLEQLSRLSGLSIELVNWSSLYNPPNVVISFSGRRGGQTLDPNAPCMTFIYDRAFVIRRIEIYIRPDDPRQRRHCILEEMTQALGLADDSDVIANSIFNDASRQQVLAPWDTLMVRVLYDPRIRPGMHRNQALPVARAIIERLLTESGLPAASSSE